MYNIIKYLVMLGGFGFGFTLTLALLFPLLEGIMIPLVSYFFIVSFISLSLIIGSFTSVTCLLLLDVLIDFLEVGDLL